MGVLLCVLLSASALWAQPTVGSGLVSIGPTPADSTVVFDAEGNRIPVANSVYALLVQQSANWLAQMDTLEAGYIAKVDSLKGEIAQLLTALDRCDQACDQALDTQQEYYRTHIDSLDRYVSGVAVLADSLVAGWDATFDQALEIIQDRDSTIHALSVAQVVADSVTVEEQAP